MNWSAELDSVGVVGSYHIQLINNATYAFSLQLKPEEKLFDLLLHFTKEIGNKKGNRDVTVTEKFKVMGYAPDENCFVIEISALKKPAKEGPMKPELKLPINLSEILDDPDYNLSDGAKKAAEKAFWKAYDANGLSNIFLEIHHDRIQGFLRRELSHYIAMEKLRE
jgi:hypothetical protein